MVSFGISNHIKSNQIKSNQITKIIVKAELDPEIVIYTEF